MNYTDFTAKLPNTGSNGTRALAAIKFAVVHHDAVAVTGAYDPLKRYIGQAEYHISKGWKRLAYHLKIDANGIVYLCSPFTEVTYHAGNYPVNLIAIGICLDGDFTKNPPPPAQREALFKTLDDLCFHRPDMPLLVKATVKTHREVRLSPTTCPGDRLHELVAQWRQS